MRNPTYEQALTRQGVTWHYVEKMPIGDINVAKSLANQARLEEALDEALVESYRATDAEGYEFPPLVTWRPGKGQYILIDGNHRLAAKLRNNRTTVDAYVVECVDRKVIDRVTWKFNNDVNGRRLTADEAMEHAITFVRKYGMPVKEAAREWAVNVNTLIDQVRLLDLKDTLTAHEVKITAVLSDDVIRRLGGLRQVGDDVMAKAAQAVSTIGPTRDEVDDLVRAIRKAKSLDGKEKVISDFAASEKAKVRKAETKGGTVRVKVSGPRERYVKLLRDLAHHGEDNPSPDAIRPSSADMAKSLEHAASIVEKMLDVFGPKVLSSARNGHEAKTRNQSHAQATKPEQEPQGVAG